MRNSFLIFFSRSNLSLKSLKVWNLMINVMVNGRNNWEYAPSSLSTSFWSFCTDLSANSARASACEKIYQLLYCNSNNPLIKIIRMSNVIFFLYFNFNKKFSKKNNRFLFLQIMKRKILIYCKKVIYLFSNTLTEIQKTLEEWYNFIEKFHKGRRHPDNSANSSSK